MAATPFQITILPPSPALAEHVLFYVARRRARGGGPVAPWTLHFPANMYSALTLVHSGSLRDPCSGTLAPAAALSGTMSRTASREYLHTPETTVVVFKPGRLTDFCRLPATDLTDHWGDAASVFTLAEHIEVSDRMAAQPTVARQIVVLEQLLMRRFAARHTTQAAALAQAVKSLVWRLPHMRVQELAAQLGWGLRRIERRFADTFGVSPRMLIRLARLQLALVQMQRREPLPLARVALIAGFADQAHLAREVKALAGFTPSRLAPVLRSPGNSAWAFSAPQDSLAPLSG
ncbi:MAG: helix-turn-helix domain-containing protein [Pseudomonadota bacterium]